TAETAGTVAGSNGNFTVAGSHTYDQGGVYGALVTIRDAGGAVIEVLSTAEISDDPVTITAVSVVAAAEGEVSTLTAAFADPSPYDSADAYLAGIDWGDGNTSLAMVEASGNAFSVSAEHTYIHAGAYTATLTIEP